MHTRPTSWLSKLRRMLAKKVIFKVYCGRDYTVVKVTYWFGPWGGPYAPAIALRAEEGYMTYPNI